MEKANWDPKPKDNKTWWLASHCGPGTLDGEGECECGRTQIECAKANTEAIKEHKYELDMDCGCSGFWCWKCGRFWAQDACWESFGSAYNSSDNVPMKEKDRRVYCACGEMLYKSANY